MYLSPWTKRPSQTVSAGFTLVEILVATALTLVIMAATVTLFGTVTTGIANSRGIIETADRLQATRERLTDDLRGHTAPLVPPLRAEWGLGYFEYIEGNTYPSPVDSFGNVDTTVGDKDILMFTTRSTTEPFIGRFGLDASGNPITATSQIAEVAWFVRGTTLYRRVLLVLPNSGNYTGTGFYARYDLSARQIGGTLDPDDLNTGGGGNNQIPATVVANGLADLTNRENRYAHLPSTTAGTFPFGTAFWSQLGLPNLQECSANNWPLPYFDPTAISSNPTNWITSVASTDYWTNPHPWAGVNPLTGTLNSYSGARIAEDVILTNVIEFDVKAWDPGAPLVEVGTTIKTVSSPGDNNYPASVPTAVNATPPIRGFGAYVDLGWKSGVTYTPGSSSPPVQFGGLGDISSGLTLVYDTWSTDYKWNDANNNSVVDSGEFSQNGAAPYPPPYPYPLRGIQVKIRVFEPDSRQIREVTVIQDFLPE